MSNQTVISGTSIFVTGGAGFIGSHLCEALLSRGASVTAYDNFDSFYDPAVKRRNVSGCLGHARYRLVEGDIRDLSAIERALVDSRPEIIVHLAARAGVRPSIEDPILYQAVNMHGTTVILECARKLGIRRFIFGSSSSVYGNNAKVPFSEADAVNHPISPYAATKRSGELLCHTYHHLYGMNVTCLRFFTVYGPRQRPDLAIHKFTRLIDAGRPIPVFGDGSMRRDHTFVGDIVAGVIAAMERCCGYHIYNLGESRPVSLAELIAAIERALDKKAVIDRQPLQPGDVQQTYADVSLAARDLGYEPRTHLDEGLKSFVAWYREALNPVQRPAPV